MRRFWTIAVVVTIANVAAVAESPDDPALEDASYNAGAALLMEGKPAEAMPHFEAVHARLPDSPSANIGLALARLSTGRPLDAWPLVRTALSLDRDNERARTLANMIWQQIDQDGLMQVGEPKASLVERLGQPDGTFAIGPQHERWVYLWFGFDVVEGRLYELLAGSALADEGFGPWPTAHRFKVKDQTFVAIYRARSGGGAVLEFVPQGQSIAQHDRMLVINRMPGQNVRPMRELISANMQNVAGLAVQPTHEIIRADENEILFHWRVADSPRHPAQHEVTRFVKLGDELVRISYLHKTARMNEAELALWTQVISSDAFTALAQPASALRE